jgi:hypothetical protein
MSLRLPIALLALIAACAALTTSPGTASDTTPQRGDIDCSGDIDVADATRLLAYVGGTDNAVSSGCPFVITQVVEGAQWGDFDCADGVGVSDVLSLLLHEAGYSGDVQSCPQIGDSAATGPGPAVCDMLFSASYRYTSQVFYKVIAPNNGEVDGAAIPQPHDFLVTVTGEVEDGVDRRAYIQNIQWPNTGEFEVVLVGDRAWRKFDRLGYWEEVSGDPLPYEPATYCAALAPDIDTALINGTPDTVNGVPATHLHLQFPNHWSARSQDFGPSSDVSRYIDEFEGSIWVAEDSRFILKMNIHGNGSYEDGTTLDIRLSFSVHDLYDETIEIEPPVP